jgi:hypothetical protein
MSPQLSLFGSALPPTPTSAPAEAWPPAPWEAVEMPAPFRDEPPIQGWEARWPDGAIAQVYPWEDGAWWWGAEVGQSRDARHLTGGPRDAIARAEAWLSETRGMIARGECL